MFTVCSSCDRGEQYCGPACRDAARTAQRRRRRPTLPAQLPWPAGPSPSAASGIGNAIQVPGVYERSPSRWSRPPRPSLSAESVAVRARGLIHSAQFRAGEGHQAAAVGRSRSKKIRFLMIANTYAVHRPRSATTFASFRRLVGVGVASLPTNTKTAPGYLGSLNGTGNTALLQRLHSELRMRAVCGKLKPACPRACQRLTVQNIHSSSKTR